MDKLKMLDKIKKLYEGGENIIEYLKKMDSNETNTIEDIMISYDFQAGAYNQFYSENSKLYEKYHTYIADTLSAYISENNYKICEAGVGEGTAFFPIMEMLNTSPIEAYGFDVSWSRIAEAISYSNDFKKVNNIFFVGDMFEMPFADNSIDIIYTSHALEPNGGKEKELLKELMRVTSKYLILFEPIYELASDEAKSRMEHHGYVKNLKMHIEELGGNVIRYELMDETIVLNKLNPTGILVIEKGNKTNRMGLCDPISKETLKEFDDCFYCDKSMLAYPKIKEIPCLTRQNAVLATKFMKVINF